MTDEDQFYLDGTVQKKNCSVWGEENPHFTFEQEGFSPSITVWCGVSAKEVHGPFFFEHHGHQVRVTGASYLRLLRDKATPFVDQLNLPRSQVWFQQDGAAAHTTAAVLSYLEETFPGKVISRKGSVAWPPRSPDLTLPDFFLWGYLKGKVYSRPSHSIAALKKRIRKEVRAIPRSMLRACNVYACNMIPLRLPECLRRRVDHLEHVLPRS